jgi:ribosome-associated translation inhibitor RaiA
MHNPVDISLRGIPASGALERRIGEEALRLERICDCMLSCQVVAEALQGRAQRNAGVAVRLIITLPGKEIVVNREHREDVQIAVREAFQAAAAQLRNYTRRLDEPGGRAGDQAHKRGG